MSTEWIDNHVTLPSDGYSRMARVGIKATTECMRVLQVRRLFTLHYCTIVAVSASSDTDYRVIAIYPTAASDSCTWRRRNEEVRKIFAFL